MLEDSSSRTAVSTASRTAGQVLVDSLRLHGVDRVFCVPGESYLAVLDALHDAQDSIQLVVTKHEGGAANMAEADGKMTGRPGICMVTRGPGATHASIGVHIAQQDSTPMILFVGQIARMSSGSDTTTGPGRPETAVWKARATISAMRAASVTSTTHLARPPNMAW